MKHDLLTVKFFIPLFTFETRRRIPRDEEERPHRMQFAERGLRFGHFERGDTQRPEVASIVVRRVRILIASDYLRCHPIRSTDECVTSADRAVQLGRNAEIHCGKIN